MKITVEKITDWDLVRDVARNTVNKKALDSLKEVSDNFKNSILKSEHSPIRELRFKITMENIPSFVSVHFVRHNIGINHYVSTRREDRQDKFEDLGRLTPVTHIMTVNAQSLINMSRKRLCLMSHKETVKVMSMIKTEIEKIDSLVSKYMVRECEYRGFCPEGKNSCGYFKEG